MHQLFHSWDWPLVASSPPHNVCCMLFHAPFSIQTSSKSHSMSTVNWPPARSCSNFQTHRLVMGGTWRSKLMFCHPGGLEQINFNLPDYTNFVPQSLTQQQQQQQLNGKAEGPNQTKNSWIDIFLFVQFRSRFDEMQIMSFGFTWTWSVLSEMGGILRGMPMEHNRLVRRGSRLWFIWFIDSYFNWHRLYKLKKKMYSRRMRWKTRALR